jgi:hypothetical protein
MLLKTGSVIEESGNELVFALTRKVGDFSATDEIEFEAFSQSIGRTFAETLNPYMARKTTDLQPDEVLSDNWLNPITHEEIHLLPGNSNCACR